MPANNGGKGVPLVMNNFVLFESDVDDEWDLSDTGSTLAFQEKSSQAHPAKVILQPKKISGKSNNSDFSQELEQLAISSIIAARMDLGSSICTNILSLEAEL